ETCDDLPHLIEVECRRERKKPFHLRDEPPTLGAVSGLSKRGQRGGRRAVLFREIRLWTRLRMSALLRQRVHMLYSPCTEPNSPVELTADTLKKTTHHTLPLSFAADTAFEDSVTLN